MASLSHPILPLPTVHCPLRVVMNTWADAIADLYAEGEPDYGWIWEMVTGKVRTRRIA